MAKRPTVSLDQKLFLAAVANDPERVLSLLAQGASVNARDAGRFSPIECSLAVRDTAFLRALRLGHLDCAEAMLPHADLSLLGANGDTPAILAVMTKNPDWIARIDASWQPAIANDIGRDALRSAVGMNLAKASGLLSLQVHPGASSQKSTSSFSHAALAGSDELLASILPALVAGSTAEELSAALCQCATDNRLAAAVFLLDNGAIPDAQFLAEAFRRSQPEMIDLALAAKDPLIADADGVDGFSLAVQSGEPLPLLKTLPFFSLASEDALVELAETICSMQMPHSPAQKVSLARALLDQLNLGLSTPQPCPSAIRASRVLRV